MLGIWFNHGDRLFRSKKHDDFECLKRFGFTDAFILIKGRSRDMRSTPERHAYLDSLIGGIRLQGIRTHGMFICSEDGEYCSLYPDRADMSLFGKKSDIRISHTDTRYLEYLTRSVLTAAGEYPLDGIQFDFLRYGYIGNGWSPEEERIYASFGADVLKLKKEILERYDSSRPQYNLEPVFSRYRDHEEQVCGLAAGRQSVIIGFARALSESVRSGLPSIELSAAMMPEGLYTPLYDTAALHYGQMYGDFYPCFDRLYPMVYTGVFNKDSEWVAELSETASACYPGSVIGLECTEPMTAARVHGDVAAIRGRNHAGISFFRYGRMILMIRDGQDTLLYNTYPGSAARLILSRENTEIEMACELEEASWLRVPGHWDLIRAFGRYRNGRDHYVDGELCVLNSESCLLRADVVQDASEQRQRWHE